MARPLADLAEPATARAVPDSLKPKLDGTAAAAETVRRNGGLSSTRPTTRSTWGAARKPDHGSPLAETEGLQPGRLRVVDNLSRLAIVEVLPTRYTKCLDGRQDVANRRIEDLLRERE